MNPKETIIFELIGANVSSYTEANGQPRRSERPYGIPAQCTIIDDDGDVREIRYVKSQKEVFVDLQRVNERQRITRLVSKPQFTAGLLVVKATQKNLLEFLRLHPLNEANAHRRTNGERTVFRERDIIAMAKKDNDLHKKQINATRLVWESNFTTKIIPVAKYLKINVEREADLILWDVSKYAEQNPADFIALLDNPIVTRHADITAAVDMGILRVVGQRLTWRDGRQIIESPANYDILEYFAEVSFDGKHRTTWQEVERQMGKLGTSEGDEEAILEGGSQEAEDYLTMPTKDLLVFLKDKAVIGWEMPHFYVNGEAVAKSNKELIAYVDNNKRTLVTQALG